MNSFNLKEHELIVEEVHRNLPPSALYEHAILYEKDAHIAENGRARRLLRLQDGYYFSDLRRVWGSGAGQFAITGSGDVSLH
jgi:hypothetical protein